MEVSGSGFYLSLCVRKKLPVAGSVDFVFRVLNGREDVLIKVLNTSSSIFEKKVYNISYIKQTNIIK